MRRVDRSLILGCVHGRGSRVRLRTTIQSTCRAATPAQIASLGRPRSDRDLFVSRWEVAAPYPGAAYSAST